MAHNCLRWSISWSTRCTSAVCVWSNLNHVMSQESVCTRLTTPTWCRRLPNTWVVLDKKGGSRRLKKKKNRKETRWTSFFPCHGLVTVGGEQCYHPPWKNIVVRPPLIRLDWIWRDAVGKQRRLSRSEEEKEALIVYFIKNKISESCVFP